MNARQILRATFSGAATLLAGYYAKTSFDNDYVSVGTYYSQYDPVSVQWEDGSITQEPGNKFSQYLLNEYLHPERYDAGYDLSTLYSHFKLDGKFATVVGAVFERTFYQTQESRLFNTILNTGQFVVGLSIAGVGLYYMVDSIYPKNDVTTEQSNVANKNSSFSSAMNFFQRTATNIAHATNLVGECIAKATP